MSTILPIALLRARKRDSATRILIVVSITGVGLGGLLLSALLPSLLLIQVHASSKSLPAAPSVDARADNALIGRTRSLVATLSPLASTSSPSQAIALVASLRPSGIHITNVSYTRANRTAMSSTETIVCSGIADTPSALSVFRANLLATGRFQSVSVPAGDLVGANQGTFSITITRSL